MAEINPVLLKELRQRFRNKKAAWLLALYLLIIGTFILSFIYLNWASAPGFYQPTFSQTIFIALSISQLILLAFVAPGLTAGAISGERERQTLNVLLTTRLSARQIVWSKLISSSAFTLLLVVATLPLYSIVFLYGGISLVQVLGVFGFYLITMFLFGCIGLTCSAFFKRTGVSTITSYGLTFVITAGTAILAMFVSLLNQMLRMRNDAMAMMSQPEWTPNFMDGVAQFLIETNPFGVLMAILAPGNMERAFDFFLPFWGVYVLVYLAVGFLLLCWSSRLLAPVGSRKGKAK